MQYKAIKNSRSNIKRSDKKIHPAVILLTVEFIKKYRSLLNMLKSKEGSK